MASSVSHAPCSGRSLADSPKPSAIGARPRQRRLTTGCLLLAIAIWRGCVAPPSPSPTPTPTPCPSPNAVALSVGESQFFDESWLPDLVTDVIVTSLDGNASPDVLLGRSPLIVDIEPPVWPGLTILHDMGTDGARSIESFSFGRPLGMFRFVRSTGREGPDLVFASTDGLYAVRRAQNGDFADIAKVAAIDEYTDISGLDVGDLNGDGDDDLVLTDTLSREVAVFLQQPDGQFTAHANFSSESVEQPRGSPFRPVLADLDRDGDLDLVVDNRNTDWGCSVFWNDGTGQFSVAYQYEASADDLAVGDADGDGDLDIGIAGFRGPVWLLQNERHTFDHRVCTSSENTAYIALADLDNDGGLDAVTYNLSGDNLFIFGLDERGVCILKGQRELDQAIAQVVPIDLQPDGYDDLLVVHYGGMYALIENEWSVCTADDVDERE